MDEDRAERIEARGEFGAMLPVLIAVGLATLDTAIVNTALPAIARDIGTTAASAVWAISAYQIAMVATILPLAAYGETVGHRRVYVAGLALFTASSLACGLSWSLATLVAARVLQGLGAAAIMSGNTALIRYIYPSNRLGRGLGLNALMVGLAFTLGPTVASAVLSVASWHWLFLINVPAGLFAAALALRSLPNIAHEARGSDVVASLLCMGFLGLLVLGMGGFAHHDDWRLASVELLVASACGLALMHRQKNSPAPLLATDLFRRPAFALSSATAICAFAAQGLAFVSLPFLLQDVLGHSQVETGILMTPWPAVVAVTALIAGRLSDIYPPGLLGGLGLLVLCIGLAAVALMPSGSTTGIVWRMMLCGAGFGFFQSPNLKAIMSAAPKARSGGASGVVATSRLLGQGFGALLVALCLTISRSNGPQLALWMASGAAGAGCVVSFLRLLPEDRSIAA